MYNNIVRLPYTLWYDEKDKISIPKKKLIV